jgi:hypothetical protein
MIWIEHTAHMGNMRNAYKILVRKPERNRPLGRCKHRLEDNIKIDLKEIGCGDVEWIQELRSLFVAVPFGSKCLLLHVVD